MNMCMVVNDKAYLRVCVCVCVCACRVKYIYIFMYVYVPMQFLRHRWSWDFSVWNSAIDAYEYFAICCVPGVLLLLCATLLWHPAACCPSTYTRYASANACVCVLESTV
jgi:hypothetical protein